MLTRRLLRNSSADFELARIGGQNFLVHGFLRHCNRGGVSPRTPHASGKAKSCSLSHSHYFRVSCKSEQQLRSSAMSLLARFIKEDCGATAIEYGLIAALIAVAAISAMTTLGGKLTTTFDSVANQLK